MQAAIHVLIFVCAWLAHPQAVDKPSRDVVQTLLPDGSPDSLKLPTPLERGDVIKNLKRAQLHPQTAQRAQQIAFLLAVMNVDYARNRDELLQDLRDCDSPNPGSGCDWMTGGYLAYLLQHGHREVLGPLLKASVNDYNAAGQEWLGVFFGDFAAGSPRAFLSAVGRFDVATQKKMCRFVGSGDGGGMNPLDLKKVRAHFKTTSDPVAGRCLEQIEAANRP